MDSRLLFVSQYNAIADQPRLIMFHGKSDIVVPICFHKDTMSTMKTMKKIVGIGICIAMLTGAALTAENLNTGFSPVESSLPWNSLTMRQAVCPAANRMIVV